MGPTVDLPAGTYSDDTQLRLAVSRCIRSYGLFDVEAFSKVELPVFLSYALGAGRGTRAAASALRHQNVRWTSNFFDERGSRYVDGGGNGAAMRIQPHVWAARDFAPEAFLPDVIRNSLATHGHPRGILGAVLHALTLGIVLREREIPPPDRWKITRHLKRLPEFMREDDQIAERWIPLWETRVGRLWETEVQTHMEELAHQLDQASVAARDDESSSLEQGYASICDRLGGMARATSGAGTTSAVLSLWLAWKSRHRPVNAVVTAANLRGSDTDTIATMTGALVGPLIETSPPGELMDAELHRKEAVRLDDLREGRRVVDFPHPDLLHWEPPRTLSDAVGAGPNGLAVTGLGGASEIGSLVSGPGKEATGWQWLSLWFGQTVLIKRRESPPVLSPEAMPRRRRRQTAAPSQSDLFSPGVSEIQNGLPTDVDDALILIQQRKFDPALVGEVLLHFAGRPNARERAGILAALLVDAYSKRSEKRGGQEES